ncbi:MAG: hypothetical protein M3N28_05160 [Actinomycetota bacterium]|nr:hypothetical protein [Actinomycetota bacterium]
MAEPTTPDLFGEERPLPAQPVATSVAAAEAKKLTVTKQRAEVLRCIRENGPISDQRGSEMSGIDPSSWRPRRGELARASLVVADGLGETASGRKATLWRVAGPASAPRHEAVDWAELAKSRPGWMGRRAFDDLVTKAIAASNGDLQAARRRVARDMEGLR